MLSVDLHVCCRLADQCGLLTAKAVLIVNANAGIGSSYLFRVDNDHVIDATKKVTYAAQNNRVWTAVMH